jgi:hypothetical protein
VKRTPKTEHLFAHHEPQCSNQWNGGCECWLIREARKDKFLLAVKMVDGKRVTALGFVTDDGRVRIDRGDLEGWSLWRMKWTDPERPSLGGQYWAKVPEGVFTMDFT